MNNIYKGSFCALITPFLDNRLDEDVFQKFIDWQISEGTLGLVDTTVDCWALNF